MTISSAGSTASLAQLRQLQPMSAKATEAVGQFGPSEQRGGQNVQGGGERRGPPPMRAEGGAGQRFGGDTLSSLLSTQSVDELASSLMEAGDADGDGLMTTSELSTALSADKAGGAGQDDLAAKIVAALDADGDGSLSSSEISSAITAAAERQSSAQAMRGPPPGPPPGGGAEGSSGSSGVFETLDANQDGVVSAEELAAGETDSAEAASGLIKAADQDGDGSLSGGEFYAMLDQGKATGTDTSSTLASLMSGSTAASDLMQKLLAQLDTALTSSSATKAVSSGASVTA
ncbi:EF-hand domain-containing protein [Caulobacter sp. RHG1]|uniref:EF-hand domain-containing protein n=1 Tax=Caulobacter sp. (strain RHG1) TaxID=2545762 RepID=UPI001557C1EB|nr:EF-hand domain-containing protein [Caulobacter sp. RHG1]NQE60470.1 hypothetical protein [Caulobacter sp. RHG1]